MLQRQKPGKQLMLLGFFFATFNLVLFISCDVTRYRPLITFLALAAIIHAAVLLGIDLSVGMPFFWTLLEAPSFTATGLAILWLARRTVSEKP